MNEIASECLLVGCQSQRGYSEETGGAKWGNDANGAGLSVIHSSFLAGNLISSVVVSQNKKPSSAGIQHLTTQKRNSYYCA